MVGLKGKTCGEILSNCMEGTQTFPADPSATPPRKLWASKYLFNKLESHIRQDIGTWGRARLRRGHSFHV